MWPEPMQKEGLAFCLLAFTLLASSPSCSCHCCISSLILEPASSGCKHGLEISSSPKNPAGPQHQAGTVQSASWTEQPWVLGLSGVKQPLMDYLEPNPS